MLYQIIWLKTGGIRDSCDS